MGSGHTQGSFWDEMGFFLDATLRSLQRLNKAAINWYEEAFAIQDAHRARYFREKGIKYARQGRYAQAAKILADIREFLPEDRDLLFHLAFCHLKLEHLAEGMDLLEKLYVEDTRDSKVCSILGMAYIQAREYARAVTVLTDAVALNPDNFNLNYRLGVALDNLERYPEAVEAFQLALKIRPNEPRVYRAMGFALEQMGAREQAVQLFKRATQLEEGGQAV
ncbi:MAG: tetratricopeptide repeat protein [Magnetococcus sp. DMHC-1]